MKKLFLFIVFSFLVFSFNACSGDDDPTLLFSSITTFIDGEVASVNGADFSFNPDGTSKLVVKFKQDPPITLLFTMVDPIVEELYDREKDEKYTQTSYTIQGMEFVDYETSTTSQGHVRIARNRTVVWVSHQGSRVNIAGTFTFKQ